MRVASQVSAQFLMERNRAADERQPKQASASNRAAPRPVNEAVRLIEDTIEAPLSTEDVARAVNISTRQLERLFRRHLGISPAAFASAARLDRAQTLLRQTAMPVTDVGIACGFTSASHFSTAYRTRFGHAPRTERTPPAAKPAPKTAQWEHHHV